MDTNIASENIILLGMFFLKLEELKHNWLKTSLTGCGPYLFLLIIAIDLSPHPTIATYLLQTQLVISLHFWRL